VTRPIDLAFVLDNLGSGGAQRQAVELAVRLRREPGVAARIAIYRPVDANDRDLYGARLAAAGVPVDLVAKHAKLDPTLPGRLGAALAGRDVVHAFMPAPALWTWLALRTQPARTRPLLIAAERCLPSEGPRLERLVNGFVYRHADAVTANARPALEEVARNLRVPRDRLHYLPNGIDLAEWDRAAVQEPPWPLEPGLLHFALIGRISAQKNHELLIAALARIDPQVRRNWRVWLVGASKGEAERAARIAARIREHGLEESVRIVAPTDRVAALLRRLDVLVLPSRYEGFPNVVLEAMAMGPLVVAAPVGDVPSLVEEGETGLLFRCGDADDLARALQAAQALGPERRRALAARARRRVEERYRIEHVAAAYLELYRRIREQRAAA
jgi:glycosyltransferase involved in cell wall biosynthesis